MLNFFFLHVAYRTVRILPIIQSILSIGIDQTVNQLGHRILTVYREPPEGSFMGVPEDQVENILVPACLSHHMCDQHWVIHASYY
jgi:alpha-D-ribose 1-methylphosphonate 5-triphosphate synthase subunit PhnI